MKTKKTKNESLLLRLIDGDRHKHRVALVTDEGEWNQHEPNTGMARMFVVMLLIHVVLIGGIIIYDFMGEEETPPRPSRRPRVPAPRMARPVCRRPARPCSMPRPAPSRIRTRTRKPTR